MTHLRKADYSVEPISLAEARALVIEFHYAKGGSNTRVATHGLFYRDEDYCLGCAWWIPPTKSAALATNPENWQGVLALSRLVLRPGLPTNAASFLLSQSRKMIDRARWPVLVTYADEWRGHTGAIYKADNWTYEGRTKPEATFVRDGVMIARKSGPKTRTRSEMVALGAICVGSFAKNKFTHRCK